MAAHPKRHGARAPKRSKRVSRSSPPPAPMFDDSKVLLTPEESAGFLNSNARTLERWRTNGTGPRFVKVGRRVHYRREALDAWIMRQERSNTAEPPLRGSRHTPNADGQPSEVA
jgi:hypothetical protein